MHLPSDDVAGEQKRESSEVSWSWEHNQQDSVSWSNKKHDTSEQTIISHQQQCGEVQRPACIKKLLIIIIILEEHRGKVDMIKHFLS